MKHTVEIVLTPVDIELKNSTFSVQTQLIHIDLSLLRNFQSPSTVRYAILLHRIIEFVISIFNLDIRR